MSLERIFVLGPEREGNPAIIVEDSIVLPRPWIVEIESTIKGGSLVITKAEPALPLLIDCKLAVPII